METGRDVTQEMRKQVAAEELWLNYYNAVLYAKGIITERERNQMASKIAARTRSRLL